MSNNGTLLRCHATDNEEIRASKCSTTSQEGCRATSALENRANVECRAPEHVE